MIELNVLNSEMDSIPKEGDLLVIQTKKSKDKKMLCRVRQIVNGNEVILQKSTNSFFVWDMYLSGQSWISRVWNLGGDITLTTSVNNLNQLLDY